MRALDRGHQALVGQSLTDGVEVRHVNGDVMPVVGVSARGGLLEDELLAFGAHHLGVPRFVGAHLSSQEVPIKPRDSRRRAGGHVEA